MKRVLLAAALLGPAAAGAVTMESLGANADRSFFLAPLSVRPSVQAAATLSRIPQQAQTQVQLTPVFRPLRAGERRGSEYGRVNLAGQLDRNLFLMKQTLGSRLLDIGMAADAGAQTRLLTFTDGAGTPPGA